MSAGNIIQGQCIEAARAQSVLISYMLPGSTQVGADSFTWWFYASGSSAVGKMTFKNNSYFQNETFTVPYGPSCDTIYNTDVMQITPEQGALVAGAILLLWAIAWTIRIMVRTLNVGDQES